MTRSWYISRRYTGVNWFDAMLWRWYDIFLSIPIFRWLRIILLIIRLDQSDLINTKTIKKQVSQGIVAGIVRDLTEVVIIQVIHQIQFSIQKGTLRNVLIRTAHINVNYINEITGIAKLVSYLLIEKVIPKISPEAESFIEYSFKKALNKTPAHHKLENLPGFKSIQS